MGIKENKVVRVERPEPKVEKVLDDADLQSIMMNEDNISHIIYV